jgi:hypothetical protein
MFAVKLKGIPCFEHRRSVHGPLLTRRSAAGRDDQGYKIALTATGDVQTFPTDTRDLAVAKRPILAGAPVAGDPDDPSAVERIAALDVHAASANSNDVAILHVP